MSVIKQILHTEITKERLRSFDETLHEVEVDANRITCRILEFLSLLDLFSWACFQTDLFHGGSSETDSLMWGVFVVYVLLLALSELMDYDHPSLKYLLVLGTVLMFVIINGLNSEYNFVILIPCIISIRYCNVKLSLVTALTGLLSLPITDAIVAITSYQSDTFNGYYFNASEPTMLLHQGWYIKNVEDFMTLGDAIGNYLRYHTAPVALFLIPAFILCILSAKANYRALEKQCDITAEKAATDISLTQKEKELTDSRTRLMLSQIQPHFLYNVLNSIYYLCEQDPERAQEAISDFSDYLRTNMDVLKKIDLVPFDRELQHIETYLRLEQMRFGDRLEIEKDLETTAFMVPELGIQPVVENAVKHGICMKEGGGLLSIRTKEDEKNFFVIIKDNGIGFDPKKIRQQNDEQRSHVGLSNITARIKLLCNGNVKIDSEEGIGTTVTISIPKEETENEHQNLGN